MYAHRLLTPIQDALVVSHVTQSSLNYSNYYNYSNDNNYNNYKNQKKYEDCRNSNS